MSYTAPEGDGLVSRVNSAALRAEIGNRLRFDLDSDRTDVPLHLLTLMKRLEQAG